MPKKAESRAGALAAHEALAATGLVLDTHVLVWLLEGDARLGREILRKIDAAAVAEGLFVAAISSWEIGMLAEKGRLVFPTGAAPWLRRALALPGIHLVPLHPEIGLSACCLEGFHGDPADRLIVATSLYLGLPLVTADGKILEWCERRRHPAVNAR